jgi:hypothetical protein
MSNLLGIWFFTALIYQGHLMDPPNPNLHLYYTFMSETRNEVFYYRDDEKGFCKRWADYSAGEQSIEQTVVEVDPLNMDSCSSDSDMLMNSHSMVKYEIKNNQLHLYLPLGEEEIVYIFSKTQ